jgi:hypothetical protein
MPIIFTVTLLLLGTMEDGQHLTFAFWGFLVLLSLETSELVDYQEYINNKIITKANFLLFYMTLLTVITY